MTAPIRTPEQRAADLQKAQEMRKKRADIKAGIVSGDITLADLLDRTDDEAIGGLKVTAVLECFRGIGKNRAQKTCEELGIACSRRLRGLTPRQREALLERFA